MALILSISIGMNVSKADSKNVEQNFIATGDVFQRAGTNMQSAEVGVLFKGSVVKGHIDNGWITYKVGENMVYSYGKFFEPTEKTEVILDSCECHPKGQTYVSNASGAKSGGQVNNKTQSNNKVTYDKKNDTVTYTQPNGKTFTVTATAYSRHEAGLGNTTANGTDLRKNSRVIAVDPRVIPLGTRVYVEGYGEAIAADTGGAIKGNKIDVHMESVNSCDQWGRKQVKVTILD